MFVCSDNLIGISIANFTTIAVLLRNIDGSLTRGFKAEKLARGIICGQEERIVVPLNAGIRFGKRRSLGRNPRVGSRDRRARDDPLP